MALGAIFMFGAKSGFTYRFSEDLPRYQYAKVKWVKSGMSPGGWPVKAQQDTLQQCFANAVVLACPILLAAVNPVAQLKYLELTGLAIWICAWIFENMADSQMQLFLRDCRKQAKEHPEKKESIRLAVLGHGEYSSQRYFMWTLCRHPNYFGEVPLLRMPCADSWCDSGCAGSDSQWSVLLR